VTVFEVRGELNLGITVVLHYTDNIQHPVN